MFNHLFYRQSFSSARHERYNIARRYLSRHSAGRAEWDRYGHGAQQEAQETARIQRIIRGE